MNESVCGLFNSCFGSSDCRALHGRIMNDELETMWEEVVMVCYKVLCWHVIRGTEENQKKKTLISISDIPVGMYTVHLINTCQR